MNNFEKYWASVKDHYFDYNGTRYYAGAKFTVKYKGSIVPAHFRSWCKHDPSLCEIVMVYPWPGRTVAIWIPRDEMQNEIIEMFEDNHYVERSSKVRHFNDSDIPELFFGWIVYIAIMLVLFIFKDRWLGWIAATLYFFHWRKKIKEENIYIEGE